MVSDADGNVAEAIFNLPLKKPARSTAWFQGDFLSPTGHPIFFSGIKVNENLQPVDENGRVLYLNLSVVGSLLADTDPIRERSLEGIALATGYTAGARLGEVQS